MLTFATTQRIYLARAVVDMRKSFDSLTSLVRNQLGKDPFTGDAFVFVGKGRDRVSVHFHGMHPSPWSLGSRLG